ncbi:MAG: DnaB-like helicase C-terminal domain-containing protein [Marinilabiliaceae bacterium]|nr:DnaB-like helicase C-terminal domain-containing protein [Marinilabiliaceae bacterium]
MTPNTNVTSLTRNSISSGYIELDRITGGWNPADLIIIGGRTAIGKTAFMTSMTLKMTLEHGYSVALFSLEMSTKQLLNRMLSSETELDSVKLIDGNINPDEQVQLNVVKEKINNAPIFIDDTPAICLQDLYAKCKQLASQHGIRAVFIDYLQLMKWKNKTKLSRNQQVSNILRSLKDIAKELNITIFVLSQLNRGVEKYYSLISKRPRLSELSDIDMEDIEQNVDTVLLIHRPEYYRLDEHSNSLIGAAEIIVAKNRSGAVGDIRLSFSATIVKFAEENKFINENNA